jgi:hypothetical protein
MRLIATLALLVTISGPPPARAADFERHFTPEALRIDLHHGGDATHETYSLDELRAEPFYAGSRTNLVDTLNLGEYLVRVFDRRTNAMIYLRGFSTVFAEWSTTDEALAGFTRVFHESIVVPFPKAPVYLRIERRTRGGALRTVFDLAVDPADWHINRERRFREFRVVELMNNAPIERAVDLVILGDGYRRDEMHKLRKDADRLLGALFDMEPFKSRKRDFNVRLVETVSAESDIDEPREGRWRANLLGCSFEAFDIPRYVLTHANKTVRDAAGNVPYDAVLILANAKRYGGGGIYGLYAISTVDNEHSAFVFTHEFGHSFAGLGDEYYASEVAYNDMYPRGVEPWEPNITAMLDSPAVKLGDLIAPGTPVPTPDDSLHAAVVGCFEGAGYSAKGLYRPTRDCRMFSKKADAFCPVCRRAIERVIDFHAR